MGISRWIMEMEKEELDVGSQLYTTLGGTKRIDSIEFISGDVEVIQFDVEPLDVYLKGVLVIIKEWILMFLIYIIGE